MDDPMVELAVVLNPQPPINTNCLEQTPSLPILRSSSQDDVHHVAQKAFDRGRESDGEAVGCVRPILEPSISGPRAGPGQCHVPRISPMGWGIMDADPTHQEVL